MVTVSPVPTVESTYADNGTTHHHPSPHPDKGKEMDDMETLFHRALAAEFGIVISAGSDDAARRLRRRLYSARQTVGRGDERIFGLSVLLRPGGEVWLLQRGSIARQPVPDYPSRLITAAEMPSQIRARGRRRPSIFLRIP